MTAIVLHTAYKFVVTETEFQVTVAGRHTRHPLNWSSCEEGYSLEGIRYQAAAQALPVVFLDEQGARHEHGTQFIPETFERAAYRGHISYNLSMTDGYYAPEAFEVWVKDFREDPAGMLARYNDFTPDAGALDMYLG